MSKDNLRKIKGRAAAKPVQPVAPEPAVSRNEIVMPIKPGHLDTEIVFVDSSGVVVSVLRLATFTSDSARGATAEFTDVVNFRANVSLNTMQRTARDLFQDAVGYGGDGGSTGRARCTDCGALPGTGHLAGCSNV